MKGLIGFYKLDAWWKSELTEVEQNRILECFHPMGVGDEGSDKSGLVDGEYLSVGQDVVGFLSNLAGWFQKTSDRPIAYKILAKAESLINESTPVLDRHFLYQEKIETCYRDDNSPQNTARCIAACEQQIALGSLAAEEFKREFPGPLVEHCGYRRLAMLYEQAGEYDKSIHVCKEASRQGWAGDWDNRIARCQGRLLKQKTTKKIK